MQDTVISADEGFSLELSGFILRTGFVWTGEILPPPIFLVERQTPSQLLFFYFLPCKSCMSCVVFFKHRFHNAVSISRGRPVLD
jgi:hypothetical protein